MFRNLFFSLFIFFNFINLTFSNRIIRGRINFNMTGGEDFDMTGGEENQENGDF